MQNDGFTNTLIGGMLVIIFIIVVIPTIIALVYYIIDFIKKINYYHMEIDRSISKRERKFWKRKLRRYYLKQIPIVNLFVKRKR